MELSELKLISASNIINLRTAHGLTQAELGAKLNYSDKTISKWERGEAIPDAAVLLQMAEIFGVTVDDLLSADNRWELEDEEPEPCYSYSINRIIAVILLGVFTIVLTVFVTLWLMGDIEWRVFLVGLSVELLTLLVLDCVFKKARHLAWILAAFVLSLFLLAYFFLPLEKPWQLFLLAVPAELIVFISCNIRHVPEMRDSLMPKVRRMVKKISK